MNDQNLPNFASNLQQAPALIRVNGRATYLNSVALKLFFKDCLASGRRDIVVDFKDCLAADSTFLGVLAQGAMQLKSLTPPGTLWLRHLAGYNHDSVVQLGLQNILKIGSPDGEPSADFSQRDLPSMVPHPRLILEAHEALIICNPSNAVQFQDVVNYLKGEEEML